MRRFLATLLIGCLVGVATQAKARDYIKIVGSSTVYPFTVAVINKLEESKGLDADIIGTGTGGGFLLFCADSGDTWPDINGASRPIKDYERKQCARNGVTDIAEIMIG
jgi:phosphate transport system substrate-binding protein